MDIEKINISDESNIFSKIYTFRNTQVILDKDLAELYQVETKQLKRAVRRNVGRFPKDFMFELNDSEFKNLRSQIGTSSSWGGTRYTPMAFTEQGVAMLSSVLNSSRAISVNIMIMRAFVQMRKFLKDNALLFQRISNLEKQQLITDTKLEQVLQAIEGKNIKPSKGIFFDGQVFDAYVFVSDLIKQATKSIILIDNYIDESILTLLTKRSKNCSATIYTRSISKKLQLDLKKHNEQYPPIEIKVFKHAHDRFLILDNKETYHIGASLKDLGKKWFAFSKLERNSILEIFKRLEDGEA